MVMVNASDDALAAAIQEYNERSGTLVYRAIALMRDIKTSSFDISLVEMHEGSRLSENERVRRVAEKKVAAVARRLFSRHFGSEAPDKNIPAFFEQPHAGQYQRCWYLVHVASRNPRKIEGKKLISPYNPTIT